MGLWSFVKDAGSSLFGSKAEAAEAPEAAAAKEEALKKEVEKLGLDAKDVSIKVDGDTVKLSGTAATPEEQEKVILAVGNVEGVAKRPQTELEKAVSSDEDMAEILQAQQKSAEATEENSFEQQLANLRDDDGFKLPDEEEMDEKHKRFFEED